MQPVSTKNALLLRLENPAVRRKTGGAREAGKVYRVIILDPRVCPDDEESTATVPELS